VNKRTLSPASILAVTMLSLAGCAMMGVSPVRDRAVLDPELRLSAEDTTDSDEVRKNTKIGILKLDEGDHDAALEAFQSGLRLNPQNGHLHFLHALTYHLQSISGDVSKQELAETGYQLALKFDPENYWAAYLLGHIYFGQQRYVDAQNQFSYGLLYAPEQPALLRAMSVASYYTRSVKIGHWAASRAYQQSPDNPATLRALLFNRAATGDIGGAKIILDEYRERVRQIEPQGQKIQWANNSDTMLSNRVGDWEQFHRSRGPSIQLAAGEVFGDSAQAEGEPMNLQSGPGFDDGGTAETGGTLAAAEPRPSSELPRMAMIDVVILSTEESRSQARGVNLLHGLQATLSGTIYGKKRQSGFAPGPSDATDTTLTKFSPLIAFPDPSVGITYNLNIFNDGVNRAEVLARPTLLAVENQQSKFYSGAVMHVVIQGNATVPGTLQELPIGIRMEVTPRFLDNDTIEIVVHAQRDNIEERFQESNVQIFAQVSSTSVSATAIVKFGETLILSGLAEREEASSKSGVPLLQQLPIVQYLFSRREDERTKKSVVILLTPRHASATKGEVAAKGASGAAKPEEQKTFTQELKAKYGITVNPNLDSAFRMLSNNNYYRNFRSGDLKIDDWYEGDTLKGAIRRVLGLFYY